MLYLKDKKTNGDMKKKPNKEKNCGNVHEQSLKYGN